MPTNSDESAKKLESKPVCDCPNGTWFNRKDILTTFTEYCRK
jgi:hypothetical protein